MQIKGTSFGPSSTGVNAVFTGGLLNGVGAWTGILREAEVIVGGEIDDFTGGTQQARTRYNVIATCGEFTESRSLSRMMGMMLSTSVVHIYHNHLKGKIITNKPNCSLARTESIRNINVKSL